MEASCSLQSELRTVLVGFAPDRSLAAHCTAHCSVLVALDIRVMLT